LKRYASAIRGVIRNNSGTLNLNFTYSTEKQAWMTDVISDFNKSNMQVGNKLIQIQGDPRGSVDAQNRILSGQLKPAAWSPASDLELNQLINAWKKQQWLSSGRSECADYSSRR
jgi:hypothetical protein